MEGIYLNYIREFSVVIFIVALFISAAISLLSAEIKTKEIDHE